MPDRKGTLPSQTGTGSCVSGHVASDMLRCYFPVSWCSQVSHRGLLSGMCRWFALVRNSTAPRVSRTLTTVVVSVKIAEKESAHGADETHTCVWNDSTFPKIHNSLAVQSLLPSLWQVPVMMAMVSLFSKKALPLVPRASRPS